MPPRDRADHDDETNRDRPSDDGDELEQVRILEEEIASLRQMFATFENGRLASGPGGVLASSCMSGLVSSMYSRPVTVSPARWRSWMYSNAATRSVMLFAPSYCFLASATAPSPCSSAIRRPSGSATAW